MSKAVVEGFSALADRVRVERVLEEVATGVREGHLRGLARKLERTVLDVRRLTKMRWQRLPAWVVPGAMVEWCGVGSQDVYVVSHVDR